MFKIYSILVLLFFFNGFSNLFAQSFKDFKNTKEGKYVYFTITGVRDQDHADEINYVLLKDKNVSESVIYKSKDIFVGKMFLKNNIDADYFRKILQSMQADFDASSLIDYSTAFDTKVSAHYPLFIDTGNQEKDKKIFDDAKMLWLKNYPKEVIKVTGRNYYDIVSGESFYMNEKPTFIDTGDLELDKKILEKREHEWNKIHSSIK